MAASPRMRPAKPSPWPPTPQSLISIAAPGLADDACVLPEDFIEYEIWYSNYITDPNAEDYVGDANDVVIIDHLSESVDFVSAYPLGQYDPNEHTYTWNIGTMARKTDLSLMFMPEVWTKA